MKYNYVYFNSKYGNTRKNDPDEYNAVCLRDLDILSNARVVSYPVDYACYPVRWLYALCHSPKFSKIFREPIKKIWYPYYFKNDFKDNKPICFVVATTCLSLSYISYLRRTYPGCKIVKVCRDLIKVSENCNSEYTLFNMKKAFDLIMSFDKQESNAYGLSYFREIESKLDIYPASIPPYDVFFAGKAKDRLPRLMEIYGILTNDGLKCHYFLTGVPKEKRTPIDGIEYADGFISYKEILQKSINARCMLEINQSDAIGLTSRFLEAIMYNKKLITDNISVKEDKFYNPKYIQCIQRIEDIDPSFVVENWNSVNYHYNDEFSPIHLIYQIDRELSEMDRKGD